MKNPASRKKQVTAFQKTLGDVVVLLLELKAKPGVSRPAKREIDEAVERLQEVVRSLPEIVESRDSFNVVFSAIKKAVGVWSKLFAKDG